MNVKSCLTSIDIKIKKKYHNFKTWKQYKKSIEVQLSQIKTDLIPLDNLRERQNPIVAEKDYDASGLQRFQKPSWVQWHVIERVV